MVEKKFQALLFLLNEERFLVINNCKKDLLERQAAITYYAILPLLPFK